MAWYYADAPAETRNSSSKAVLAESPILSAGSDDGAQANHGFITAGLIAVWAAQPVPAAQYVYEALTEAPKANKQGAVRAGSLTWECRGNRCTISGPWATPGVSSCKALAKEVGRLRGYGHARAQLSSAQLRQCNLAAALVTVIAERPTLMPGVTDVPKLTPLKTKDPSQKDLVSTIGPTIHEFSRVNGTCPYPDPKARILRYRVGPAADGTPVARIRVWRNFATGASALAYSSPGSGSLELRLENEAGLADAGADPRTVAFVLQATDARDRSTSMRLPFQYDGPSELNRNIKITRVAVQYDRTRRDYVYDVNVAVRGVSIESMTATLKAWDIREAERINLPNLRLETASHVLPTEYIAQTSKILAQFHAGTDATQYHRWSVELAIGIGLPASCSREARLPALTIAKAEQGTDRARLRSPGIRASGGGGRDCPGEGTACTTRPAACAGREADFEVSGRTVCEGGRPVCRAELGRDYCTACGGVCGACVTESCSLSIPCAPGSTCGIERSGTGTQLRCRSLTVAESSTGRVPCVPRNDICWLPSEVAYEPAEADSVCYQFCADR
jgi:hypothetical protein